MILKRMTIAALAALVLMAAFTPAQELAAQETTLTGDWGGILKAPNGMEIELDVQGRGGGRRCPEYDT